MQCFPPVDLEILILFILARVCDSRGLLESCPCISVPLEVSPRLLLGLPHSRGGCITSPAP